MVCHVLLSYTLAVTGNHVQVQAQTSYHFPAFEHKFTSMGSSGGGLESWLLILSTQVAEELLESVHGTGDVYISLVKAGSAVSGSSEDLSVN